MSVYRTILVVCFALFLSSCAATPVLTVGGDISREIRHEAPLVAKVDISPDGRYALSGGFDSFILWDILQGKKIQTFDHPSAWVTDTIVVAFSPDGKYFASGGKGIKLWDLSTRKEKIIFDDNIRTTSIAFSPDGKNLLSGGPRAGFWGRYIPPNMQIFDVSTGKEIKDFDPVAQIWSVAYSPDGKYALSGGFYIYGGRIDLWDVSRGKPIKTEEQSISDAMVLAVSFSANGQYALSGGGKNELILWDAKSLTELKRFVGHKGLAGIWSVAFSPDGKYALSATWKDSIKIWDIESGTEWKTLTGHSSIKNYSAAKFFPNSKYVISAGDASTRIWDVSTGEEVASMIAFKDGEWIVITREGYYNASARGAEQYLSIKVADNEYSVDQFYDVFYRPDIVSAKLRGEDISGLVSITMKDAIKNPPPAVEFTSKLRDTAQSKVNVCYRIKSTGGGIGEVRLFHNGKLVQSDGYYREVAKTSTGTTQLASLNSWSIYADMRSLNIKAKTDAALITSKSKGDLFEDCKEIDAIAGENEVSVSAFNGSNTVQSYMKTVSFNSKIKQEDPHLYILAVGIDQYKDTGVNLKYAAKDARDIEEKIKVQAATLYTPWNIHYELLTDREATKVNITKKIDALMATIKPQDSFILFVAGHGVLLQNQYYMLTHDFNGQVSNASMISSNEIVEMSKKIKSLSQLLIFDTCHAGGVDTIVSGLYDARMSVLAKKMGLHIYASASDKQAAMDGYKGNGLFTSTLLDGLNNNKEADKNKDGKVSIVGLGEYSKKMTTKISKEIGHSQTPLIINFGKDSPLYKLQ
ncbi:MAG: caspase family protein [Syntrophales bacterium]